MPPVKIEPESDDDQRDTKKAKQIVEKEKEPKEARREKIAKLEKKIAKLKQLEEKANVRQDKQQEEQVSSTQAESEEASAAKKRQEDVEAELRAFEEEQRTNHEKAVLEREKQREKIEKEREDRASAAFFKEEIRDSAPSGQEAAESERKEAIPSSFVSLNVLEEMKAKAKRLKAEEREKKRKAEEEEAKKKEADEASKKVREEAVAAYKQEKLEAKRKADSEEYNRLMMKAKADPKTEFAAGFCLDEKVEAVMDIKIKGKVVVMKGNSGTIQGPAEAAPKEKLSIKFKKITLVVLPDEIKRPGGLPGGKEKEVSADILKKVNLYGSRKRKWHWQNGGTGGNKGGGPGDEVINLFANDSGWGSCQ
eukprot:gnl/MRDRNA2_/MRDRNA2_88325_c1_seq1.p1 gnl/MRDRNA2_/MRDRNA2_88325_c1~~gnl/MRDRNA2_/MRDRNA2_88325_c1_seq1.p1  ORF type:complete len:419 (-),score=151.08 gnl/MRDRNA2_/MRDRNA2_88325_c1_seq1:84-1178(-)